MLMIFFKDNFAMPMSKGKKLVRWLSLAVASVLVVTCKNPYEKFSLQSSDEALYHAAMQAYNNNQFVLATQYFQQLSPGFLGQREVRFNYAKSLAGRCGYTFLDFVNSLQNANFSNPLFKVLLSMWGNKQVLPQYCTQAELQVKQIWAQYGTPTIEEKLFIVLLALSKMGMYLRSSHDIDENGGLGNGVVDTGVDSCTVDTSGTVPKQFTDMEIKEVITGLALANLYVAALASVVSNATTISNALNTFCTAPGVTFCSLTDTASVTAADVKKMRGFLVWDSTGLDGDSSCLPVNPTPPPPLCCP
jgi:hypothetical protein